MTTLEPSWEKARSRTSQAPGSGARQRIDSRPESRSCSATTLGSDVDARRLLTGEKATRPCWGDWRSVRARMNRRLGMSHKSTRPLSQPTARRVPSGEKLIENPLVGRFVSVTSALLRVSCQR